MKHSPQVSAAIDVVHSVLRHLTPSERAEVLDAVDTPMTATEERTAEHRSIDLALRECASVAAAAARLGMSPRGLQKRMRALGIPPQKRGPKPRQLADDPPLEETRTAIAQRISDRESRK